MEHKNAVAKLEKDAPQEPHFASANLRVARDSSVEAFPNSEGSLHAAVSDMPSLLSSRILYEGEKTI